MECSLLRNKSAADIEKQNPHPNASLALSRCFYSELNVELTQATGADRWEVPHEGYVACLCVIICRTSLHGTLWHLRHFTWCRRDSSVVKSRHGSYRGPEFSSHFRPLPVRELNGPYPWRRQEKRMGSRWEEGFQWEWRVGEENQGKMTEVCCIHGENWKNNSNKHLDIRHFGKKYSRFICN